MAGIPGDLNRRLQEALLDCGPFNDPVQIQALFNEPSLRAFRHNIPGAVSPQGRVAALIDYLYNKPFDRPNPLARFLAVLSNNNSGGCTQQLRQLANEVAATRGDGPLFATVDAEEETEHPSVVYSAAPLELNREEMREFEAALLAAFGTEREVERMVRYGLGEDLHAIAGGRTLRDLLFDLVLWAERHGRLRDLICEAHKEVPGNPRLAQFAQRYCPPAR